MTASYNEIRQQRRATEPTASGRLEQQLRTGEAMIEATVDLHERQRLTDYWIALLHEYERAVDIERMLEEATELDAETFMITSRLADERVKYSGHLYVPDLIKVRESVRRVEIKRAEPLVHPGPLPFGQFG